MTNNTQRSVEEIAEAIWKRGQMGKPCTEEICKRAIVEALSLERQKADKLRQELDEADKQLHRLTEMYGVGNDSYGNKILCACNYDEPGDVCFIHKKYLDLKTENLRQENEALKAQVSGLVSALTNCIQCTCTPQLANRHNHQYGCCVLIADKALSTLPSTFLEIQKAKDACVEAIKKSISMAQQRCDGSFGSWDSIYNVRGYCIAKPLEQALHTLQQAKENK